MSQYRRSYLPGGTFFLTVVTYQRIPIFLEPENITLLRTAIAQMRQEKPFKFTGAVILPDHLHFLWTLPHKDSNYSQRVSRFKTLFTRSLPNKCLLNDTISASRRKHRERNVWQRRFWEHTIKDEIDLKRHLDYIHYNPVKHGLVSCPHLWQYSSFHEAVKNGIYDKNWACSCQDIKPKIPDFVGMICGE
ncbi:REP-associated tyrosine transposase [Crocosphaera sp. XPORK-15E]|uniref:REP-associated tyrosine transposase n=1 Tax=Crocosphaera sp. XPORK-15E TaxID=3110247 RepID=UPI002B201B78|nr:transposase [Crocosphaera sp. XPORK-15E]MEA5533272.1 transposase [Crocosphaera sp. XPORK-15E]